jgi:LPS sulfotransferase NodH
LADEPAPARGYVICATQRSGSTYLSQLLTSSAVLGKPLDFFNPAGRRDKGWHDYPDAVEEQLELVRSHGATANGIYACKAFPEYLDALAAAGWTDRLPGLQWVYLRRTDLLGQAISLVIASQTGRWRSSAAAHGTPAYDAGAIAAALAELARGDVRWRAYFARHGIGPLELSYESVAAHPLAALQAVAALMAVDGPLAADPSLVEVAVQRDGVNAEWRTRFLSDQAERRSHPAAAQARVSAPALVTRKPRLTVAITTRNSETTLPRLLAETAEYADEIVVGVDASSTDRTLTAATAGADVVYRFRLAQRGQLAPARLLPFEYASGDWILSLDDDESMEGSFDSLAEELLRAPNVTHYYFPRKWIVNDAPWEYLHAPPWFPNWSPRLFRNDRSLIWKPALAHSMYQLQGPGFYEERTSILHFEPLWCAPEERERKLASYRAAGAGAHTEEYYSPPAHAPRRTVTPRPPARSAPARAPGVLHAEVRELVAAELPPWCSVISDVDLPRELRAGERVIVQATARNTGTLAWSPTYAQWPANLWPLLRLSYHLFAADGTFVGEGDRTQLPRFVPSGGEVTFITEFPAPAAPGEYVVQWDMISENSCWFAACGSTVYRSSLRVRA